MQVEVPEYEVLEELRIPAGRSVLLIVDMQNDFVDPEGALAVPGAPETVPTIRTLADRAREGGVPVWYTQDTHRPGDPEWEIWGEHVAEGSWGWEIVEELRPREGDRVFPKARYDGFYGTSLDHHLRVEGRDHLVVCGTVANICVHYTAASAGLRYLNVVHPVDGISAITEFDRQAALRQASWLFQAKLVRSEGLGFEEAAGGT